MDLKESKVNSFSRGTYRSSLTRAFGGDAARKKEYLNRVRSLREAGRLLRGRGSAIKGECAVSCTVGVYDHERYQAELGVPLALVYLKELLFERLPVDRAMEWPERFLSAIEPGADLSFVPNRFVRWLLADYVHGVISYTTCEMADLIRTIASCHEIVASGGTPAVEQLHCRGAIGTLRQESTESPLLERIIDVIEWAAYGLDRDEPRFAAEAARTAVCVGIWGKAKAMGRGGDSDTASWIETINTMYERQSNKVIELLQSE